MDPLSLRRFNSCTIANAVETFEVMPREFTYTGPGVHCVFPDLGPMVGYACTATIHSGQPAPNPRNVDRKHYWQYTRDAKGPKLTVIQDLSPVSGGAYWGEVNANIHKALGSQGLLTNGSVRDIEEVKPLGFHFFSSGLHVSHGYAHLEEFNRPVKVFGLLVHPDDLLHCDKHGAALIPKEIAEHVYARALEIEEKERPMIACCKSPDFSIDDLDKLIPRAY
jgi:regulator of RNase E activity RraA